MSQDSDWRARSACRDTDPEVFFPPAGSKGLAAKQVCWRCPVKSECLDYALADPYLIGVWGGTSDYQRKQWHNQRKAIG